MKKLFRASSYVVLFVFVFVFNLRLFIATYGTTRCYSIRANYCSCWGSSCSAASRAPRAVFHTAVAVSISNLTMVDLPRITRIPMAGSDQPENIK